uniref:Cnidarian restricted protein n=3 Tax=Clytia hemisphaerica TaxID=252671 RepID=A0A7M5XJL1_9CNID
MIKIDIKMKIKLLCLFLFNFCGLAVGQSETGVCGTNTVYYTVYTSVIKTRISPLYYTDSCCSTTWGKCESCQRISYKLDHFAFVSSRQQAKEVVICCVGYAY